MYSTVLYRYLTVCVLQFKDSPPYQYDRKSRDFGRMIGTLGIPILYSYRTGG